MIFFWIDVLMVAFSFFALGMIAGHKLPRICRECEERREKEFVALTCWFFDKSFKKEK